MSNNQKILDKKIDNLVDELIKNSNNLDSFPIEKLLKIKDYYIARLARK